MAKLNRYKFANAVFDESTCELLINGLAVDLRPQSLRILSLLLTARNEIVTKKELDKEIWEGRDVGENAIASAITRLRNSLGESNEGLIESIPRKGYRITKPIQCIPVGRSYSSRLEFAVGMSVPGKEDFVLERMLGQSHTGEAWLARNVKSKLSRVFKFAENAMHLASLKREATISRVLFEHFGERDDIVRLLDWNFENPPFYLESEYAGDDLLTWGSRDDCLVKLNRAERIALFLQIANAVAAAHSVSVIHKDLKPGNILISGKDGAWQTRLVDFGSGRLLDASRLAELGITELGATMTQGIGSDASMGTLMYIAPELLRQQPSTVRSDIYALGILLYQVLVGDLRRPMAPGWERNIDDPLLLQDLAGATDGDPARRTATVAELINGLSNLEQRRTELAAQLAAQAQANKDRELARQSRARRPWLAAIIVSLLLGLTFSGISYFKLRQSEQDLIRQNQTVVALNHFLQDDLIAQANPAKTGRNNVTVKEAAIKAAANIDTTLAESPPALRGALHASLQSTMYGLTEYGLSVVEGNKALSLLEQDSRANAGKIVDVRIALAVALEVQSRFKDAEVQLDAVKPLLEESASDAGARYWWARGSIAMSKMAITEGLAGYAKANEALRHAPDANPDTYEILGFSYADANKIAGNLQQALAVYRDLIDRETRRYGADGPRTCYTSLGLANTLAFANKTDEAIGIAKGASNCLEKSLGEKDRHTATAHEVLGNIYFQDENYASAAKEYETASRQYGLINGENSVSAISTRLMMARSLQSSGHAEQCQPILEKALIEAKSTLSESSPLTQTIRYHIADCRLDSGSAKDVHELLAGLTPDSLNKSEIGADWEGRLDYQEGRLLLLQGDKPKAIPLLEKAAEIIEAKNPDGRISADTVRKLIKSARSSGRH